MVYQFEKLKELIVSQIKKDYQQSYKDGIILKEQTLNKFSMVIGTSMLSENILKKIYYYCIENKLQFKIYAIPPQLFISPGIEANIKIDFKIKS